MKNKELKRMRRAELVELMLAQSRRIDELEQEVTRLQAQLDSRDIAIGYCGSIAEASLTINHVFEAAQLAANQYLENVKRVCSETKEKTE